MRDLRNRAGTRAGLVLLAVLVLPAGVGAAAARAASAPPGTPAAVARLPVIASATLGVLDRAQTALDRRAVPAATGLVPTSVRRIGAVPSVGAVVQVARNSAGEVCLIASMRSGAQFTASCADRASVERTGLTLQFSITAWAAVNLFSERGVLPRFVTIVWTPEGPVHLDQHTDASA